MALSFPNNVYPYKIPVSFSYDVVVTGYDSTAECAFSEVSGLNVTIELETIKEGGVNEYSRRFPNRAKYENLVLKRGLMKGSELINWVTNAVNNFEFKPTVVIVRLLDEEENPTVKWTLSNAYPVGIKVTTFNAQENSIVFETLELTFDFFKREDC